MLPVDPRLKPSGDILLLFLVTLDAILLIIPGLNIRNGRLWGLVLQEQQLKEN